MTNEVFPGFANALLDIGDGELDSFRLVHLIAILQRGIDQRAEYRPRSLVLLFDPLGRLGKEGVDLFLVHFKSFRTGQGGQNGQMSGRMWPHSL